MNKRQIEIFSTGCPACQDTINLVRRIACPSCQVTVLDMQDANVANRAQNLGVKSVPAIAVNGKLVSCCQGRGPTEEALRQAGIGQA